MSKTIEYDFQTPKYTSPVGKFIKLDTVNNQIEINDPTVPKQILINTVEISNGVQNINFVNLYEKLDAVKATVYPAPNSTTVQINDTLILDNGSGSTTTLDVSALTLNGSGIGGPTNTVSQGDMTITDNTTTSTSQITADYVQFTAPSYSSNMSATQLNITGSSYLVSTTINTGNVIVRDDDGGSTIQAILTTDKTINANPYLQLIDTNGISNYLYFNEINADSQYCFSFNNNNRFFKQLNPFSQKVFTANDGDFIEASYPFVLADNITSLKLYPPSTYLDDSSSPGWSCIVSNCNGVDVQIDTSGYQWYAHSNGLGAGPITLKKWATVRITLLFSTSTVGDYVWAVSQF